MLKLEDLFINTKNGRKNLAEATDEEFESYLKDIGFDVKDSVGGWSYSSRQMLINSIKNLIDEALFEDDN